MSLGQQLVIASLTYPSHCQCRAGHVSFCTISRETSVFSPRNLSFVPFRGFRKGCCQIGNSGISSLRIGAKQHRQASPVMAVANEFVPSMADLPLMDFINVQGRIDPTSAPGMKASVFAVFDKNKTIRYIGFSNDIRNSLKILMGRRPEFCHHYKAHNLSIFDHQLMRAIRQQWISEVGFTPMGNSDPIERALWERSPDPSISKEGRVAAAITKSKTLKQMRGLRQEMVSDPKLLGVGKRGILPSKEQSEEVHSEAEHLARTKHSIVQIPFGGSIEFDIVYKMKLKTNVGWMYDVAITKDNRKTRHRVICGRIYPESVSMLEDEFVEVVMGFLLHKKVPWHTEGFQNTCRFPVNFFSVSEVVQNFDDLKEWFNGQLPDHYQRFDEIYSYVSQIDPESRTF